METRLDLVKVADPAGSAEPPDEELAPLGQLAVSLAAVNEPTSDAIEDRTSTPPPHPETNYDASGTESRKLALQAVFGDRQLCAEDMTVLAEQFGYRLYCHICSVVHNPHIAEDLTQDTLVKAWRSIGNADITPQTVSRWLYRIATNTAYDHLRALQVRTRVIPYSVDQRASTESGDGIETEGGTLQLAAPSIDIESALDRGNIVDTMFDKLAREYPGLRYELVLRLQYYEGLTVTEMAQVLGVDYKTMKQRTYRARCAAEMILTAMGVTGV